MKDLKVTLDLNTEQWWIENIQDFNPITEVLFNVKQINKETVFNNLKFGFTLKLNDIIIQSISEPSEGITYISSDQDYLKSIPINVIYNREYVIDLWVENDGKRYEKSHYITTPKPEQPFNSWTWNEQYEYWEAPIAKPENQPTYVWSEDSKMWVPPLNLDMKTPENAIWNPSTNQWEILPDYDLT
jgi:hypothetical protein